MQAWIRVATFLNPSEAHIVRGLLESETVPVRLSSEHHISVSWQLSQALGGVGVSVPAEFEGRALELLAAYHCKELERAVESEFGVHPSACPVCGSQERRPARSWGATAIVAGAFLVAGVTPTAAPPSSGDECGGCGAQLADDT